MSNPAKLEFLRADTFEKIDIGNFGNEYKNSSNNILPLMIVNSGGKDAINVKARFISYRRNNNDGILTEDIISKDWKEISYDSTSSYEKTLDLPNIPAGKFMAGFKIYAENFNNIITPYLPPDWDTAGKWEIYSLTEEGDTFNSYLQHIADSFDITTGRVIPKHFPNTRNCDVEVEMAVPRYNFGGIQLRLNSATGYGYFVIIYPDPDTIRQINEYYSEIIGSSYTPIDSYHECAIGIGKGIYTDLDNMAFPNIYNKCYWLPKGMTYRLERDTLKVSLKENVFNIYINNEHKGTFIDPNPINDEGAMALIAGRRYDTRVIFDDLKYKIETNRGILFLKSVVPPNPADSITDDNEYYSSLLIEYSE